MSYRKTIKPFGKLPGVHQLSFRNSQNGEYPKSRLDFCRSLRDGNERQSMLWGGEPVLYKVLYLYLFLFFVGLSFTLNAQDGTADGNCLKCHTEIKSNCNLTCSACHLSDNAVFKPAEKDHPPVIQNPSREEWWQEKCASCHALEIEQFQNSLHYSIAGIINQTRYLWGKDQFLKSAADPDSWKDLKTVKPNGRTCATLVDQLLAQKCMSCHFDANARLAATGQKRAAGCAACHSPLDQQSGKALFGHRFQKKVYDKTCLTCHNSNYVGADYHGYFEHDYHAEYATPFGSEPVFGAYQHRLAKDVHQSAGMMCMDCHKSADVMGEGHLRHFEGEKPVVRCSDCHGGFKSTGNKESIKQNIAMFSGKSAAHQPFHKNVTCSACHAQWSYQDYGLHLFLDESDNYTMWDDVLWQGDARITDFVGSQLTRSAENRQLPVSVNTLTGESLPGIWYKGWTFRRWEDPVLGVNAAGQYSIIRPLYQYRVTYVDSIDNLWLDSVIPKRVDGTPGWSWDAYVPHTIGKKGRTCESCHGNAKAAGYGIRQNLADSVAHPITIPSKPVIPGSRLLNTDEQHQLMQKSSLYKKWRTRAYRQSGIEKLFDLD